MAERAHSTSKLLREDVMRGVAAVAPQRQAAKQQPSWAAAAEPAAGGAGGNASKGAPGGGVAGLAKRLEDFEAAFARISNATGTADVDALVAELGAKEDGNFRLFGYVGEVNASVEALCGRMREVSAELERWNGANAAKDSDLSRSLQELREKLEGAEAAAAAWEAREAMADARAAALADTVQALWTRSGCAGMGLEELLGGGGVVGTQNLMQYLGAIEQRTNHLLHEAARSGVLANGADAAPEAAAGAASAVPEEAGWDPTRILPSTLVDPDDGDASAETGTGPLMPLDRKALESRAVQSLARKREQARNAGGGGAVALSVRPGSSSPARRPPLTALGRTAAAVKRPALARTRR
ncbi:g4054 [Coccomyxa elongata]